MQIMGLGPNTINTKTPGGITPAQAQNEFSQMLKNAIEEVNTAQMESDKVTEKMAMGQDVDLHTVMITSQKSGIMLQTTMEVRNKAVEAYQEIMRMQI